MIRQYGGVGLVISFWILLLTGFIYWLNIGEIKPIDGTKMIVSGKLCSDQTCLEQTKIDLPYFTPMRREATTISVNMQFQFNIEQMPQQVYAIYLPKLADNVSILLNGIEVRQAQTGSRLWNKPILTQISTNLLRLGQNKLDMVLHGAPQEGLELYPIFIGPIAKLEPIKNIRTLMSVGVARFSMGLMGILFAATGVIWLARREEKAYLWLSLSCLSAVIFLAHFGYDLVFLNYKYWTLAWTFSIYIYVFFIIKFINQFLGLSKLPFEKFYLFFFFTILVMALALPANYIFNMSLMVNLGTALLALNTLALFWLNKQKSTQRDFIIFFTILSASLAIGLYELILDLSNIPPRNLHLLEYMPLIMSSVCLWLIMSRLIRSLTQFEKLTDSLQDTIVQKTDELTKSYKNLADAEKHKAIDDERTRIMLDLHDGIGGQLVNSLAYMENHNIGDDVLRNALEDALRELALMLDSLENDDSITTLLGMLRTRLEALLTANGLEFDWQIGEEPILPNSGPSQNLHLVRIVQEAITNIIKHANASIITVATNASTVTIKDNGKGFDAVKLTERQGHHGIASMQRRAAQIGAQLELSSTKNGTEIKLVLL